MEQEIHARVRESIEANQRDYYLHEQMRVIQDELGEGEGSDEINEYFEKVDEPTVICMFGDHQPTIEPEFVEELLGAKSLSSLSAAQEQRRHMTPFYIWANYDIEEAEIDKMSANYLSSLVLKTAGVELTEYNRYLLKLYETLPVINTVGYIDNADNYYKWSDVSPYTDLISEYEKIQYNCIFDSKNLKTDTFYLKDYVHKPTELVEPGKEIKQ
jgi:hypothetical protein